ncbi:MAG TPA: sialidase family protein [Acidimicrobiales bacterium]|nr:sialidase family protein [Acidimicrobiales bacterium]
MASTAGVMAAFAGVAGADTAATPATFRSQGPTPRVTAAVRLTKDEPAPTRAYSGPFMLADPDNPRVIVAATADLRTRVCYLLRSSDAGRSWRRLKALPTTSALPFCTSANGGVPEAQLAWGRNHTLYYALNGQSSGSLRTSNSVLLARSTNLGDTWSTTVVDDNEGKTDPPTNDTVSSVAVDTEGPADTVYVGWFEAHPGVTTGPNSVPQAMVARSSDGGVTFASPVDVDPFSQVNLDVNGTPHRLVMYFPVLAAGHGVVEAIGYPIEITGTPPQQLLAARSTDQGKTWTVSAVGVSAKQIYWPVASWSPKGGSQGTFLVAYQGGVNQQQGEANILFVRSTDGGASWSPSVRLDDDQVPLVTHFTPQIDVAPNGRVDVVWYDFRLQQGFAPDLYYTHSSDNGATWSPNQRLTDRSIDFTLGVSANSDVRQPPGVASADQYAAVGWTDTRLGTPETQTQDLFGDLAQFSAIPSSKSATLPVLASAFAGLLVAGVVLGAIAVSRRRKGAAAGAG